MSKKDNIKIDLKEFRGIGVWKSDGSGSGAFGLDVSKSFHFIV